LLHAQQLNYLFLVKNLLKLDYPQPEDAAFRPIYGFATANSFYQTAMINATEFERQSRTHITAVKDGGFLSRTKNYKVPSSANE